MNAGHPQLIQTLDIIVLKINPFVVNILTSESLEKIIIHHG